MGGGIKKYAFLGNCMLDLRIMQLDLGQSVMHNSQIQHAVS